MLAHAGRKYCFKGHDIYPDTGGVAITTTDGPTLVCVVGAWVEPLPGDPYGHAIGLASDPHRFDRDQRGRAACSMATQMKSATIATPPNAWTIQCVRMSLRCFSSSWESSASRAAIDSSFLSSSWR